MKHFVNLVKKLSLEEVNAALRQCQNNFKYYEERIAELEAGFSSGVIPIGTSYELFLYNGTLMVRPVGQTQGYTPSAATYGYAGRDGGSNSFTVYEGSWVYPAVIDLSAGSYSAGGVYPTATGFRYTAAGQYVLHASMQLYRETGGNSTNIADTVFVAAIDRRTGLSMDFWEGGSGEYIQNLPFSVDFITRFTMPAATTMEVRIGVQKTGGAGTSQTMKTGRTQFYTYLVGN